MYIVIANWNRRADTLDCLRSVAGLTYPNLHVIVVDNGSTDGSVEAIAQSFPNAEQLRHPLNLGFAGGYNSGVEHALSAGAEHILVLNNDTLVAPDVVERLLEAARPEAVGIVAPVVYYADQPDRVWSAGSDTCRVTLELRSRHGRAQRLSGSTERDFVSGCAMLLKRSALERVGLFDERFFVYYEDLDLCHRMREAGYRLAVVPEAKIWHKISTSSDGSDSPAERYWMAYSSVLFFLKHIRGWRWGAVIPVRLASALRTTLRLWMAGRHASIRAYWQGLLDAARGRSSL